MAHVYLPWEQGGFYLVASQKLPAGSLPAAQSPDTTPEPAPPFAPHLEFILCGTPGDACTRCWAVDTLGPAYDTPQLVAGRWPRMLPGPLSPWPDQHGRVCLAAARLATWGEAHEGMALHEVLTDWSYVAVPGPGRHPSARSALENRAWCKSLLGRMHEKGMLVCADVEALIGAVLGKAARRAARGGPVPVPAMVDVAHLCVQGAVGPRVVEVEVAAANFIPIPASATPSCDIL